MFKLIYLILINIILCVLIHIGYNFFTWEYWVVFSCGLGLWIVGYIDGSNKR